MLATNVEHQRNVTNTHVVHLAQQMEKGQWQLNGEGIIFDLKGRLIDGQHRLTGLVRAASKSIRAYCVFGVSDEAEVFDSIDAGVGRQAADTLAMNGTSAVMQASAE